MNFTKLPTMKISNPFSNSPVIAEKINWILKMGSYTVIILLITLLGFGIFYLNIKYEQNILMNHKVSIETDKAFKGQSGIVIDATTDIIKREGKLDDNIAKQYAIWIFDSAAKYAVDPMLLLSVISIESRFDYKAVSPTGPIGLMQIAASYHKDKATAAQLFDPQRNIQVGAQILKEYSDMSSSIVETLLRFNGSLGGAPVYATKVILNKRKFEAEVMTAMIKS